MVQDYYNVLNDILRLVAEESLEKTQRPQRMSVACMDSEKAHDTVDLGGLW